MIQNKSLDENDKKILMDVMMREVMMKPPTIGLIGVSGVGKSSTINTLFKTELRTSNTVACTKEFEVIDLSLNINTKELKNLATKLRVIDAPGLGEDLDLDPDYIRMYKENLPQCDVILWIQTAKNRAVSIDQSYLQELKIFHNKIIFGLNQVDLIEPMDWNTNINLPSVEQKENILEIINDRKKKLSKVIDKEIVMIPFSCNKRYNLQELFSAILQNCPEDRMWIFEGLKNFKHDDFLPDNIKDLIIQVAKKQSKKLKWYEKSIITRRNSSSR